jgi:hypothetical protein
MDVRGSLLRIGDRVRVIGEPNLDSIPEEDELQTRAVFTHLRGSVKRINSFNQYGLTELTFRVRSGNLQGWHSVSIEPYLLLRQSRGHAHE